MSWGGLVRAGSRQKPGDVRGGGLRVGRGLPAQGQTVTGGPTLTGAGAGTGARSLRSNAHRRWRAQ
jgi:hypothetical protein